MARLKDRAAGGENGAGAGCDQISESERAELALLRRENAELAVERAVLKRSVAGWVTDAMGW